MITVGAKAAAAVPRIVITATTTAIGRQVFAQLRETMDRCA